MHPQAQRVERDTENNAILKNDGQLTMASRPFSVRLNKRERQLISRHATAEGVTSGEFIRRRTLTACGLPMSKRTRQRDELATRIEGAIGTLGRISSSANQIARAANGGFLPQRESIIALRHLEQQLLEIRETLRLLGGSP